MKAPSPTVQDSAGDDKDGDGMFDGYNDGSTADAESDDGFIGLVSQHTVEGEGANKRTIDFLDLSRPTPQGKGNFFLPSFDPSASNTPDSVVLDPGSAQDSQRSVAGGRVPAPWTLRPSVFKTDLGDEDPFGGGDDVSESLDAVGVIADPHPDEFDWDGVDSGEGGEFANKPVQVVRDESGSAVEQQEVAPLDCED